MANAGQSRETGPLFFLKTGCPNKVSGTAMYIQGRQKDLKDLTGE